MKYPIIFSLLLLSSTLTTTLNAQTTQQEQATTENNKRRPDTERQTEEPKEKLTPEQKAQKQTDILQKKLGLTEEQKTKVYALNYSRITKSIAWREQHKTNENKQASKEEFQKIRTDYDTGLKDVLNDDQEKTWAQLKADVKARRDARHQQKSSGKKPAKKTTPAEEELDHLEVD